MHHICHVQIGRIGGNLSPIFSLLLLLLQFKAVLALALLCAAARRGAVVGVAPHLAAVVAAQTVAEATSRGLALYPS